MFPPPSSPFLLFELTRFLFLQLVLADQYDRFKITYTGCHVFNPGSFVGSSYVFSAYKPAETNSEEWLVGYDFLCVLIRSDGTVFSILDMDSEE